MAHEVSKQARVAQAFWSLRCRRKNGVQVRNQHVCVFRNKHTAATAGQAHARLGSNSFFTAAMMRSMHTSLTI